MMVTTVLLPTETSNVVWMGWFPTGVPRLPNAQGVMLRETPLAAVFSFQVELATWTGENGGRST
jgi:hypothetical protein